MNPTDRPEYKMSPEHQAAFDIAWDARCAAKAAQGTPEFPALMAAYLEAGAKLAPFNEAEHAANIAMAQFANMR